MNKIFLFFFLLLLPVISLQAVRNVGAYPTHPSSSQNPSWFIYDLLPGDNQEDTLTVVNQTPIAREIQLYPADWVIASGGGFALRQQSEVQKEMGRWITLTDTRFTIPAGGKKVVPFHLSFPLSAPFDTTICGGIALEVVDPIPNTNQLALRTRSVIRVYNHYKTGVCENAMDYVCPMYAPAGQNPMPIKILKSDLSSYLDQNYVHPIIQTDETGEETMTCPPARVPIIPSPERSDQSVRITVKAIPEKRIPATGNWGTTGTLLLNDHGQQEKMEVTTKDDGTYETTFARPGNYEATFKGRSHLSKIIPSVSLNPSSQSTTIDFSFGGMFQLLAGDIASNKDDIVNALDIAAAVQKLYQKDDDADLNKDGVVNSLDIGIAVANLYKKGNRTSEK